MKLSFYAALLFAVSALSAVAGVPSATALGPVGAPFVAPARVATDGAGQVYITDSPVGRVTVVDAFNRVVASQDGFATPVGIAVDATGRRYVGESGRGSVTVFDAEWNRLGQLGADTNEFLLPGYVALDAAPDGLTVYVSDGPAHEIKAYREGTLVRQFGSLGNTNGQFNFPAGLWVNPAGELFVVDQNNDRVQVFDRGGAFLRAFTLRPPGRTGRSGRAQGIVGDSQGRLYVADTFQGYVKVYESTGAFLGYVGAYGEATGQMLSPGGVAFDGQGRLFVTSANTARVEAYGLDCFTQLLATPASQLVAVGSTVTFTAQPGCAGTYTYQWRKGTNELADAGVVSGAATAALTLTGVSVAEAGNYSVTVSDTNGTAASPEASLRVTAVPTITQSPASRNAVQGTTVVFTVAATGEGVSYQWFFNGIPLLAANAPTLTLTDVPATAAGRYWVVVTNVAGPATSAQATLTVLQPPAFVLLPEPQIVPERGMAKFSALAVGTEPVRYLWFRNGALVANQTNATLVLSNVTPGLNGSIVIHAYNAYGNTNSPATTLTVLPDTNAPVALSAAGGRFTNRTVLVTFSEPLTPATAQNPQRYQVIGPGNLFVTSAVLQNSTNVLLTLNGPRTPNVNYALRITGITDTAYTPNVLAPNPTTLALAATVELISINTQPWKYLQIANRSLDSQPWEHPAYNDTAWSNGFGIFFGHGSNNITQPNPNPNVRLPFPLSAADTNNTKVYTVLNVFTNVGGVAQENTYYFRTAFNFAGETNGATLQFRAMVDDGAVIYLNGVEKTRIRLPAAPTVIYYATLATSSGSQNWDPAITNVSTAMTLTGLRQGTNVLAVEVHQNSTTSNDITLGLQLEAGVLRFASAVPILAIARAPNGDLALSWSDPFYVLQTAATLSGPWETAATVSPFNVPWAVVESAPAQFFRLRRQ
jgi:sugar lactone lactonase YvrE